MNRPRHRGPHPEDPRLFAAEKLALLRTAVGDLGWLLDHGYVNPSALKLVGDRYQLEDRQRLAVMRSACTAAQRQRRIEHRCGVAQLAGSRLMLDGYNLLTTLEAALSGGVLLFGRDGCLRDLASMHGTYRKVDETVPALELIGEFLARAQVAECHWLFDSPVSNSGRLKTLLAQLAHSRGWNWAVELAQNPDGLLAAATEIIVTADSAILDRCERWFNLMPELLASRWSELWVVDLSEPEHS
jgi:hypothetical protein